MTDPVRSPFPRQRPLRQLISFILPHTSLHAMNLEASNLDGDLNKSLDDIVKGIRKDKKKQQPRRGQSGNRQRAGRGRGLAYASRAPAGGRGQSSRRRGEPGRVRQYVEVAPQHYRYAPRYVEAQYRYAPVYVQRHPRPGARQPRGHYRRVAEEPIRVRYEELPRQDIRIEGTARLPRSADRVDANRARRRQEFERRRQETSRANKRNTK